MIPLLAVLGYLVCGILLSRFTAMGHHEWDWDGSEADRTIDLAFGVVVWPVLSIFWCIWQVMRVLALATGKLK